VTCRVQSQLDKATSDTSTSDSSSSDSGDDEMPQLSPITDVPSSPSVPPLSTIRDSSAPVPAAGSVQQPSTTADKLVGKLGIKSTTDVVRHTQLHCVCHTPYDETRSLLAISCQSTSAYLFLLQGLLPKLS